MAHNVNYNMKDYNIIWADAKNEFKKADLVFGNLEAPIDSTKPASSYPYFNMPVAYAKACIDAGVNVFSLSNNHTNDQKLDGIKQTIITTENLKKEYEQKNRKLYFSGLKQNKTDNYSYCVIEQNGFKILYLAMTEILNKPVANENINYINSSTTKRTEFIEYIKELKKQNPCDLFILSWHANETEYIRTVTSNQQKFYQSLLDAGVDVIWANHAHIIKDRKIIHYKNPKKKKEILNSKLIMYANGNTISGQRTKPNLKSKNPNEERDNTGDGLFYKVVFYKDKKNGPVKIYSYEPLFITTYITEKREYIIKFLNDDFIKELTNNSKKDWAQYAQKRLSINKEVTKDIIEWQ